MHWESQRVADARRVPCVSIFRRLPRPGRHLRTSRSIGRMPAADGRMDRCGPA